MICESRVISISDKVHMSVETVDKTVIFIVVSQADRHYRVI